MSQFEEKISLFNESLNELNLKADAALLEAVAKGLGPALYNSDAAFVATSDKEEVERVKKNFLIGKLGLSESDDLDGAIEAVAEKMGKSNTRKHRAIFYYLLVKHFNKGSVYN